MFAGENGQVSDSKRVIQQTGVLQQLTYDTERLSGEAESTLPSSVTTAASRRPDADDVFQPKHHYHDKLLQGVQAGQ